MNHGQLEQAFAAVVAVAFVAYQRIQLETVVVAAAVAFVAYWRIQLETAVAVAAAAFVEFALAELAFVVGFV